MRCYRQFSLDAFYIPQPYVKKETIEKCNCSLCTGMTCFNCNCFNSTKATVNYPDSVKDVTTLSEHVFEAIRINTGCSYSAINKHIVHKLHPNKKFNYEQMNSFNSSHRALVNQLLSAGYIVSSDTHMEVGDAERTRVQTFFSFQISVFTNATKPENVYVLHRSDMS